MSNVENSIKFIGLDIGTSRVVAAQKSDSGFQFKSQLNAFLPLPYSKQQNPFGPRQREDWGAAF